MIRHLTINAIVVGLIPIFHIVLIKNAELSCAIQQKRINFMNEQHNLQLYFTKTTAMRKYFPSKTKQSKD